MNIVRVKEPTPTMKLYVWEDCVNRDYTAGDLCVMAPNLREARKAAAAADRVRSLHGDDSAVWMRKPDKILAGVQAVHASLGGA